MLHLALTLAFNLRQRLVSWGNTLVSRFRKSRIATPSAEAEFQPLPRPSLPPDLLDIIFDFLQLGSSSFNRRRALRPLLLVCKEWHNVALRKLCSSMSLGWAVGAFEDEEERCEGLVRSITRNPDLALLVRNLRIGPGNQYTKLLPLCKNVECLDIAVYSGDGWDLKDALEHVNPVEFSFSVEGFQSSDRRFCSPSKLLSSMVSWSRLQRLNLYDVHHLPSINANASSADDNSLSSKAWLPGLQEVQIMVGGLFYAHPDYLRLLSEMAPNVKVLSYEDWTGNTASTEALRTCLRRWSSALTRLSLFGNGFASLDDLCQDLGELRFLAAHSSSIRPDTLFRFKKLENLYYRPTTDDNRQLSRCFQTESTFLPSLRSLIIVPAASVPMADVSMIYGICRARDIEIIV